MGSGIMDLVGFAATVAVAAPVAVFGVIRLSAGDLLTGVAFLVIAAGMIAIREWLTTPGDVPGLILQRVTGRVVKSPDDEE